MSAMGFCWLRDQHFPSAASGAAAPAVRDARELFLALHPCSPLPQQHPCLSRCLCSLQLLKIFIILLAAAAAGEAQICIPTADAQHTRSCHTKQH